MDTRGEGINFGVILEGGGKRVGWGRRRGKKGRERGEKGR